MQLCSYATTMSPEDNLMAGGVKSVSTGVDTIMKRYEDRI